MAFGDIYVIEDKENSKAYVGKTTRWIQRVKEHKASSNNRKSLIDNMIKKYGVDRFSFRIIDQAESKEELDNKEKYYIGKLNTIYPTGYNLTLGGDGGIACSLIRDKISSTLKGREFSIEHREKLTLSKLGSNNPNFGNPAAARNFGPIRSGKDHPNYGRRKSHCKHSHLLAPENIYVVKSTGERRCLECHRKRSRESARKARLEVKR